MDLPAQPLKKNDVEFRAFRFSLAKNRRMQRFANRRDAAVQLAAALDKYKDKDHEVVVLGIPRGGAETAYYLATWLRAELSLLVCRKLGHPANPEYALGAVAEDGTVYIRAEAGEELPRPALDAVIAQQTREIQRRIQVLRQGRALPAIKGRTVILADDGIATGATLIAGIRMCRNMGATRIVVAAPVSSRERATELEQEADEVVILVKPALFFAVSEVYRSFYNLSDGEALAFMEKWERERKTNVG